MDVNALRQILPPRSDLNAGFLDGCASEEFRLQVCILCGAFRFPPSFVCPKCLSTEYTWREISGRGKLWSWIVMHQNYFDAFADDVPYVVLFVELDEGPFVISQTTERSEALYIGAEMQVTFVRVADDIVLPNFRLLSRAGEA